MEKNTIIVNLFGAPGTGKSTGAAYIFAKLKLAGVDAELVTEFAKDKVWEESKEVFNCQFYVTAKQMFRVSRCYGKVDVIVTDSPIPLGVFYKKGTQYTKNFDKAVFDVFNSYKNKNYYLYRVKPYNPNGRFQTEDEADDIANEIVRFMQKFKVSYTRQPGCEEGYDVIVQEILKEIRDGASQNT